MNQVILAALMGFLVGLSWGYNAQLRTIRKDAIKAGVAEYVIVDMVTGKIEFKWKSTTEATED
jgi:hypothetical protein